MFTTHFGKLKLIVFCLFIFKSLHGGNDLLDVHKNYAYCVLEQQYRCLLFHFLNLYLKNPSSLSYIQSNWYIITSDQTYITFSIVAYNAGLYGMCYARTQVIGDVYDSVRMSAVALGPSWMNGLKGEKLR